MRPGTLTRRDSFQRAAGRAARVLFACAILLVGCGFIEGYISPNPGIPMISRGIIGGCYWFIMLLFLSGAMFRSSLARRAADAGN
jgi:hypothetical protein